ncbi:MAG: sulfur carrier protein ThiS [Candidatus Electrothrix sp. AR3]|nr:sulfur carrier protein ThiS [Candidatus Electrothrix sp. AR3]
MQITLNGQKTDTASQTLHEMIEEKGFNPDTVIAELNFELIKQENRQQVVLSEGDTVELLSFVGGG